MKRWILGLLGALIALPANAQHAALVQGTPYAIPGNTSRKIIFAGQPNSSATVLVANMLKKQTLKPNSCNQVVISQSVINSIWASDPQNGTFGVETSYYYLSNFASVPIEILNCTNGVTTNSNTFKSPEGAIVTRFFTDPRLVRLSYESTQPFQRTIKFDACGMGRLTVRNDNPGGSYIFNGETYSADMSEVPDRGFLCKNGVLYQKQN